MADVKLPLRSILTNGFAFVVDADGVALFKTWSLRVAEGLCELANANPLLREAVSDLQESRRGLQRSLALKDEAVAACKAVVKALDYSKASPDPTRPNYVDPLTVAVDRDRAAAATGRPRCAAWWRPRRRRPTREALQPGPGRGGGRPRQGRRSGAAPAHRHPRPQARPALLRRGGGPGRAD